MRTSGITMHGSKNQHFDSLRYKLVWVGLGLLAFFAALVGSCDDAERHKVLDYFFDGVPPFGQEPFEAEFLDPNTQQFDQTGQTPTWYVHEPRRDCTNCHRKRRSGGFSAQTYLTAPVPKLCYNCHENYAAMASVVHGPVAVGQCLFCHNPHKSRFEHLLKKPEPDLCYLCHDESMIALIPAHLPEQQSACTECHDPHAGSTKALLKGNSTVRQEPLEKPPIEPPSELPTVISERQNQLGKRQRKTAELYYRCMTLYREGELTQARAGFVKVLESGLIPAPMANTLQAYIAEIDHRLAKAQNRPK